MIAFNSSNTSFLKSNEYTQKSTNEKCIVCKKFLEENNKSLTFHRVDGSKILEVLITISHEVSTANNIVGINLSENLQVSLLTQFNMNQNLDSKTYTTKIDATREIHVDSKCSTEIEKIFKDAN